MIENFDYDDFYQPPRPMILVDLEKPNRRMKLFGQIAHLDTGADCCLLTETAAANLKLKLRRPDSRGLSFGGSELFRWRTAEVTVAIGSLPKKTVRAAVDSRLPYMLLGRDFLNDFRVLFDGPDRTVSIS